MDICCGNWNRDITFSLPAIRPMISNVGKKIRDFVSDIFSGLSNAFDKLSSYISPSKWCADEDCNTLLGASILAIASYALYSFLYGRKRS